MSTPDSPAAALPHGDPSDYVQDGAVLIGCSRQGRDLVPECIELKLANRHGLVTGATGTGKTVTLQVLAEGFSAAGVPVFAADIKGDLSGIAVKGEPEPKLVAARQGDRARRATATASFPVVLLGRVRQHGHPVRATVAGDGAAAAVAPARADRAAGGRAQHRLPLGRGRARCRRRQDGDPRPEGSARGHRRDGQARHRAAQQVRQRRASDRRRHPAPPAGARAAGRRQVLRRAGARHHGFHQHRARRPRRHQHSRRPRS